LIEKLFAPDDIITVYSHVDRIVTLGAMPVSNMLIIDKNIDCWKNFGVTYLLERRELGIINIGGDGIITADDIDYPITYLSAMYVSMGTKSVCFKSLDPGKPAKFYMCSAPAHSIYPTTYIPFDKAVHKQLGASETSNKRTLHQYLHPDIVQTNQLLMGCTQLDTGSVWNTMPCHTHERRMEVYMYFDITENNAVFHLMGKPQETRHIVIRNEQAIILPSWSIHSGCGTSNYSFIWAMAGENIQFDDMDTVDTLDLR